jgi:hypothetical protein
MEISPKKTLKEYEPELLDSVRRQIEYYFSKDNLLNDKFLASHMDANMSVPIAVIMKVGIYYYNSRKFMHYLFFLSIVR